MGIQDREYVEALKKDDLSAFDVLFKKYSESLYAFALSISREPYIAEEVTQLVFMKIWEKRSKIEADLPFKSYIFSIAYSETISWIRKINSEDRKKENFRGEIPLISNETSFTIEFNNINSLANQMIECLPEKRKEIFKLSREQGYSNKEIAAMLDISVKTIENQMTSALKTLREKLGKYDILGAFFYFIMFHENYF